MWPCISTSCVLCTKLRHINLQCILHLHHQMDHALQITYAGNYRLLGRTVCFFSSSNLRALVYQFTILLWISPPTVEQRRSAGRRLNIVNAKARRCSIHQDPISSPTGNKRRNSHLLHLFGPHVSPDCWSGCHIYQHLAQSPAAASGGSGLLRGTAKSLGEGRRNEARRRKRRRGGGKRRKKQHPSPGKIARMFYYI